MNARTRYLSRLYRNNASADFIWYFTVLGEMSSLAAISSYFRWEKRLILNTSRVLSGSASMLSVMWFSISRSRRIPRGELPQEQKI